MLVDAATARRSRGAVRLVQGTKVAVAAVHSPLAVIAATGRRDEASNA